MPKFFINYENEQDEFEINQDDFTQAGVKMLDFICSRADILNESALKDYDCNKITLGFDVLICDNDTIREINKEYRNKDTETDVISFALFADSPESRIVIDNQIHLGQIIISAQKTFSQAKENNKTFKDELYFLLSHGILHLFGFDHPDEEKLCYMLDIQSEMISNTV